MKHKFFVLFLVVLVALAIPTAALAMGNPVGEITAIDESAGTMTLLLFDGEELLVTLPDDFDYSEIAVGMIVKVKGTWTDEGITASSWVKEADAEDIAEAQAEAAEEATEQAAEANEDTDDEGDSSSADNPFCTGEKEYAHPLAVKIASDYEVTEEWVMEQKCAGFGFGQIMLALQTAATTGENADDLLATRSDGKGWGQIWKETGIVDSDHADRTPPGQLKKQDKTDDNSNNGNGNGPSDDKGKPDDKGKSDDKGKDKDKNKDKHSNNENNNNDSDDD